MRISASAYALATLVQFIIGTFIFGTIYAVVLYILRLPASLWAGAAIGAVHGIVVGLVLPLVARFDPGIRTGRTPNPGIFAANYGWIAPPGLVAAHVVYGIIYGLVYAGGTRFLLADAWLAGVLATAALTVFVLAGRVLGIAKTGTLDMIAASIEVVLEHRAGPSSLQRPLGA